MKKETLRHLLPIVLLTIAGAVGGYAYHRLVGCSTGACAITASPVNSTVYGAVIGLLLGIAVTPDRKKKSAQ